MWTAAGVAGGPPSTDPVVLHQVNAGYFPAMGLRLASGRLFTDSDVDGAQHIALVNERFVRTRLDGHPPLGQIVRLPRLKQGPFELNDDAFQIVGVLHDALNQGLSEPVLPEIIVPFTALGVANVLVVRTEMDPASLTRAVTAEVHAVDKNQPVTDVQPLEALINDDEYATPRFNLTLLSVFAALGLMLAIIGVYGVMSTVVAQQTHEIGVRIALGATGRTIAGMVMTRGAWLLGLGIAAGLLGSVITARMLTRQVWNVQPFDPLAFGAVSLILLVTGLLACFWPARRAARIDPISALRDDA
jgi:putative ABC transport system permease protein